MEHREGATLADEMAKAPFPVQDLLRRAIDLATALNQLHRQGRVHGAVGPETILVTQAGVELIDAPAAPRSVTPYTAPEQLREISDARSDIFAFGAVVYEMATGRRAFAGDTPSQIEGAILEDQPPAIASLRTEPTAAAFYSALDRVVSDCLTKTPDQRRQRMQNVLVDLKLMSSAARAATPKAPAKLEVRTVAPAEPPQPEPPAIPVQAPAAAPLPEAPRPETLAGPLPLLLVPTPQAMDAAPSVQAPAPLPYKETAAEISESAQLPSPTAQEQPVEDRAIAERRASAILSQVGFGQTAPYVMDPAELKEHKREKERRGQAQGQDKQEQAPEDRWAELLAQPEPAEADKPDTTKVRILLDSAGQKRMWTWLFMGAVVLAGAAVIAFAGWAANTYLRKPTSSQGVMRFPLPAPEQASYLSSPAISPDGKLLAFSAVGANKKRLLWIRPLSSLKAESLAETDDGLAPFWSPDGKYLGFFAGKKLKKVPAEGGPVTVLCDTEGLAGGGTWSRDGVIVFGRSFYDGLYRVRAGGGTAERVTKLDSSRGERAHLWPLFLPDGKHFLFYALTEDEDNNGVSIGSLDAPATRHLLTADTNALYAEKGTEGSKKGYLLYGHSHRLTAQEFDPVKLALGSDQFNVADDISYLEFINLLPISAANNGLLAYQSIDEPKRLMVWLDREGNQEGVLGEPGVYKHLRISPDGRYAAVDRKAPNQETADIWLYDLQANRSFPFTSNTTHEGSPVWSPDGKQLVYFSNPRGRFDLFHKSLGTNSSQEPVVVSGADKYASDWSADGKYLMYGSIGASTGSDLWIQPMKGKGDPFVYLQTVSTEGYGQFSPDGKWVAYQSDESGRGEVYVEPFPRVEGHSKRWQISTDGGGLPKWREDSKELYYITMTGKMMAVTLNGRDGLNPAAPKMLFQTRALPRDWNMFDATPDGRRFLVNTPLEWASSSPITVIANWAEGFKK